MIERPLCRLFGHRIVSDRHLSVIFGCCRHDPPTDWAGHSGFCSRCWMVFDDVTGDAAPVIEGPGEPERVFYFPDWQPHWWHSGG